MAKLPQTAALWAFAWSCIHNTDGPSGASATCYGVIVKPVAQVSGSTMS